MGFVPFVISTNFSYSSLQTYCSAGRVRLELTYISLTGRPPADGAPANMVQRGTIRTSIALAFNQALYQLELPLRISISMLGRLPGPVSPHRYPDQPAVPLHSPSLNQTVSNNRATGPEPNQVLPHPLATFQAPQSWSRWHGIEPATSCLQGRRSNPLSYTGETAACTAVKHNPELSKSTQPIVGHVYSGHKKTPLRHSA